MLESRPVWTLDVRCDNCQAQVTYNSQLGSSFKLSEARKEKELYRRAQQWVTLYGRTGHPEGIPGNLQRYIYSVYSTGKPDYLIAPQPRFYYVKCPVCRGRIYVC